MSKKSFPLPVTDGFPGYGRGATVFNAWVNALCANANTWNGVWDKTMRGKLRYRHWARAVAQTIDSSYGLAEQAIAATAGPSAPPWVVVKGPVERYPLRISRPVDPKFDVDVNLTLLAGQQNGVPTANVRARTSHALDVQVTDANGTILQGQEYIGLIFSADYPDPVGIVFVPGTEFHAARRA